MVKNGTLYETSRHTGISGSEIAAALKESRNCSYHDAMKFYESCVSSFNKKR